MKNKNEGINVSGSLFLTYTIKEKKISLHNFCENWIKHAYMEQKTTTYPPNTGLECFSMYLNPFSYQGKIKMRFH